MPKGNPEADGNGFISQHFARFQPPFQGFLENAKPDATPVAPPTPDSPWLAGINCLKI